MKPAVYYRMEQWPKDEKKGCYVLVDSAPGAHHGEVHVDEAFGPRCRGRFGSALDLHGPAVGDYAIVPDYPKTDNDQLSVSAWVWAVALRRWIDRSELVGTAVRKARLSVSSPSAVHPDHHLLAAVLQPRRRHVVVCRERPRVSSRPVAARGLRGRWRDPSPVSQRHRGWRDSVPRNLSPRPRQEPEHRLCNGCVRRQTAIRIRASGTDGLTRSPFSTTP